MLDQFGKQYPEGVEVLHEAIAKQLKRFEEENILQRFQKREVELWSNDKSENDEIAHRLDWLDAAEEGKTLVKEAGELLDDLVCEGYTHAVVLGMGGSSLAPEVYSLFIQQFGGGNTKRLTVSILDSTSPEQILETQERVPLEKTLFIVSSKSGTTVEVKTLLAYFWEQIAKVDAENPGKHFIAISDPGSKLLDLAAEKKFRKTFQANPNVGGRYSALIAFGLVPAVLAGYDGEKLLKGAEAREIGLDHPGVKLGVVLGAAYKTGRDKLTILSDTAIAPLGSWIEQLVAESSGKIGEGILPIDQEPMLRAGDYGDDRIFTYLRIDGTLDETVKALQAAGQPVYTCDIKDLYDISGIYYCWEIATAIACIILGVNAFNQPNVQESKDIAKRMINALKEGSNIDTEKPVFENNNLAIFSKSLKVGEASQASGFLRSFAGMAQQGDFLAVNAFVARNEKNEKKLEELRKALGRQTELATTLGFGPRFLHSTGQLHKGGKNNGLFVVISQDEAKMLEIPGEGIAFNGLIFAQALGDTQALEAHDCRVVRVHFKKGTFDSTNLVELFK